MNDEAFLEKYLPENLTVGVAFGAMAHFLALHFNQEGGTKDVADFIRGISNDEMGRPISDEIFKLFKEAIVRADRLEMVGLREPTQ